MSSAQVNVLIVGNGGREHALCFKLAQSEKIGKIFVAPGNGGTSTIAKAENIPIGSSKANFDNLVKFAVENNVSLVVPGPEQPLVDGISSYFQKVGIPVFGPSAKAAVMEGSKTFSKDFMKRHNIPTADFQNFTQYEDAKNYILKSDKNLVIKASGIAAGKGVLIPQNKDEALAAIKEIMVDRAFGSAGDEVVVEEFLEGDELSILCMCDGYTILDLPPAQDHKRIGENDTGLNTGGMGAYSPAPLATPELLSKIRSEILQPTMTGMRKDGYPMVGCLFVGIMVLPNGEPSVLEYNVRFGDPETQTVLPLLDTDLFEIMTAAVEGRLDCIDLKIKIEFSTTVVMSAAGYPESYPKGDEMTIATTLPENTYIFHAGTSAINEGKIITAGGRVIAATATASTLKDAVSKAYIGVDLVQFKGKYFRKDIAHRAFRAADALQKQGKISVTYENAGVSVDNGNKLVENIKQLVRSTARPGADSEIGGFGGLFDLAKAGYTDVNDILVVGATDGVGTKLRVAQVMNIHNTVGIDLVAMNVNDLVVQGAEPLIFLDYFATGKLDIQVARDFVEGVATGCKYAGSALVGGETSEMPGMYAPGHYDTNGTAFGALVKDQMLPKTEEMEAGNVLIGLKSDGVHSNGFSLLRKVIEKNGLTYESPVPFSTKKLGEELLIPTRIYVKQLLPSIKKKTLLGLAHITGGGLVENIPRALPSHLQAVVDMATWEVPEIFKWFGQVGGIPVPDILKTLNMGIGMVAVVKKENVGTVIADLANEGESAVVIGELINKAAEDAPGCIVNNSEGIY